jgi:hypothetical protein
MHKKLKHLMQLVILTERSEWKDRQVDPTQISTEVEKSTEEISQSKLL